MEFGEKLKKVRKQRGVSQQQLTDAIFVSRSAVAKWENGLGLPGAESFAALLDYFDVTEEDLLTDRPEQLLQQKNRKLHQWRCGLTAGIAALAIAALMVLLYTKPGVKWAVRVWQQPLTLYAEELFKSTQMPESCLPGWSVRQYDADAIWFERDGGGYTGLVYSADGEPKGFQGTEMTFYRFGAMGVSRYLWAEADGDNWMMLERIDAHWFWYEMHF